MNKQLVKKLQSRFAETPRDEHVFTTREYATETKTPFSTARWRLTQLAEAGLLRRVKLKAKRSDGQIGLLSAWEYIENADKR